nr:immunoglobulin light chain junction region [Macaca mulatta]MPN86302.1 immunoglobulin light chain junction region [Macaca mulatta]
WQVYDSSAKMLF